MGPRVRATVLRRADSRNDVSAVARHLGVLFDDVAPAVLIEDHQSPFRLRDLGERFVDSGQTWISRTGAEKAGLPVFGESLVGWVDISTGERFHSEPMLSIALGVAATVIGALS